VYITMKPSEKIVQKCKESLNDYVCLECHKDFIPQEDTPAIPIEEKCEWDGKSGKCSNGADMKDHWQECPDQIEPLWYERAKKEIDNVGYVWMEIGKTMNPILLDFIHSVEKAAEEKARVGIIQDILELCRYNGEIQSVDILKYAKVNGISLQAK